MNDGDLEVRLSFLKLTNLTGNQRLNKADRVIQDDSNPTALDDRADRLPRRRLPRSMAIVCNCAGSASGQPGHEDARIGQQSERNSAFSSAPRTEDSPSLCVVTVSIWCMACAPAMTRSIECGRPSTRRSFGVSCRLRPGWPNSCLIQTTWSTSPWSRISAGYCRTDCS